MFKQRQLPFCIIKYIILSRKHICLFLWLVVVFLSSHCKFSVGAFCWNFVKRRTKDLESWWKVVREHFSEQKAGHSFLLSWSFILGADKCWQHIEENSKSHSYQTAGEQCVTGWTLRSSATLVDDVAFIQKRRGENRAFEELSDHVLAHMLNAGQGSDIIDMIYAVQGDQ